MAAQLAASRHRTVSARRLALLPAMQAAVVCLQMLWLAPTTPRPYSRLDPVSPRCPRATRASRERGCRRAPHPQDPSPRADPDPARAAPSSPRARSLPLVCPRGAQATRAQPCLAIHQHGGQRVQTPGEAATGRSGAEPAERRAQHNTARAEALQHGLHVRAAAGLAREAGLRTLWRWPIPDFSGPSSGRARAGRRISARGRHHATLSAARA